ncbi:hypothetical protein C5167_046858 [Papaver somniferum]|uniref:Uncharacterized protein n=1 Tax=Papaver somniferum TaxID=3469 RepID=A0A4Y7LF00_PAPSO|nr:hypothetical protein C5167_046858 [Papaver somniferum]
MRFISKISKIMKNIDFIPKPFEKILNIFQESSIMYVAFVAVHSQVISRSFDASYAFC